MVSKAKIKYESKFHIQIFWYSFTGDLEKWAKFDLIKES